MTPSFSLAEFRAQNTVVRMRCSLWVFLQGLPPEDVAVVRQAIKDESIQASAIVRVLRARGFTGSHLVVSRHRRETCVTCETSG